MIGMERRRVCVVTGGTGGIGQALCEAFFQAGYQVAAVDLQQHRPLSEGIEFFEADLASAEAVAAVFEVLVHRHGAVHVLINNGAIAHFNTPIQELTAEALDQVLAVNLRGGFLCCKAFVEANRGEEYGRIINIASTRWNQNEPHWEAYGATKGGLVALTQSLAVSLSETPITVNAISPGWIHTGPMEELRPEDHAQHPSGRVGIPRDIANACLFLAEEENDFINGHNWVIDGGMSRRMIYL